MRDGMDLTGAMDTWSPFLFCTQQHCQLYTFDCNVDMSHKSHTVCALSRKVEHAAPRGVTRPTMVTTHVSLSRSDCAAVDLLLAARRTHQARSRSTERGDATPGARHRARVRGPDATKSAGRNNAKSGLRLSRPRHMFRSADRTGLCLTSVRPQPVHHPQSRGLTHGHGVTRPRAGARP